MPGVTERAQLDIGTGNRQRAAIPASCRANLRESLERASCPALSRVSMLSESSIHTVIRAFRSGNVVRSAR